MIRIRGKGNAINSAKNERKIKKVPKDFDYTKGIKPMTEENYTQEEAVDAVYKRPGMWLGSDKPYEREEWCLDLETMKPEKRLVDFPQVPVNVFREVVANCMDGIVNSFKNGWEGRPDGGPSVEFTLNKHTITATNYGVPIAVKKRSKDGKWIPEVLYSNMFSSSNFQNTETKNAGGTNGIGAKGVNIFSTEHIVEILDGFNGKKFRQVWRNNMKETDGPEVTNYPKGSESSVTVTYKLDFERFGYKTKKGYPQDIQDMFAFIVLGNSFTAKQPVSFNGQIFDQYFHIKDYGEFIYGQKLDNVVYYYELLDEDNHVIKKKKYPDGSKRPTPVDKHTGRLVIPKVELMFIDPPKGQEGTIVSFASHIITIDNGVQVDAAVNRIGPVLRDYVNNRTGTRTNNNKPKGKGKGKAKPKEPQYKITMKHVRPAITLIVSVTLPEPGFPNQYKTQLVSPTPEYEGLDEKVYKPMMQWNLVEHLRGALRAMELTSLHKTDGRKVRNVKTKRSQDADWAGGPKSKQCTLLAVEGDSAKGYANTMIGYLGTDAKNTWGVFTARGKVINPGKASVARIQANIEFNELKRMLGLKHETDYTKEENFKQLRYGKLMMMTDMDHDGTHIKTLVWWLLFYFFPSLFQRNDFFYEYRTKYLRVQKGKKKVDFFTTHEFEDWKAETPDWKKWKQRYFKGMGSSKDSDVKEDVEEIDEHIIKLKYTQDCDQKFEDNFGKDSADRRKEIITEWEKCKDKRFEVEKEMLFSTILDKELILYVLTSLERAIPKFGDGYKKSQCQIIYGIMKHWSAATGHKPVVVAQLVGIIAMSVAYHHGPDALGEAIMVMGRNFIGSNNVPLICDDGQFGSVLEGGKDRASPRYPSTLPRKYFYKIFRKDDAPILEYNYEGELQVEPKVFYPVVPTALLNGFDGIATGYRAVCPNYNPYDLIEWIMSWLTQGPLKNLKKTKKCKKCKKYNSDCNKCKEVQKYETVDPLILVPWYKGFEGEIGLYRAQDSQGFELEGDDSEDDVEGINEELPEEYMEEFYARKENRHLRPEDPEDVDPDYDGEQLEEVRLRRREIINNVAPKKTKREYDQVEMLGCFHEEENGDIVITQLPIGRWPINYLGFLEKLREEKKCKSFIDNTTKFETKYVIKGLKGKINHSKLRLRKSFRLSNLVFLDEDNIPHRYKNVEEYMEKFCEYRLSKYVIRQQYWIKKKEEEFKKISDKARFVKAVVDGELVVSKRKKDDVLADMKKLDIPDYILTGRMVDIIDTTKEKLKELLNQIEKGKQELDEYKSLHPGEIWYSDLKELMAEFDSDPDLTRTDPPLIMKPGEKFPSELEWEEDENIEIVYKVPEEGDNIASARQIAKAKRKGRRSRI